MGRRHRPHLPGATFHITARVQAGEPVFTPALRTRFVGILRDQIAVSQVGLFAYALMPNHLHLILRQGDAPLQRFMQPLLRKAALLVQKRWRREGHVFERRYRDRVCGDADYLRNAIVYAHLNPIRAGLADDLAAYPWISRSAWCGDGLAADGGPQPVDVGVARLVFATVASPTARALKADYQLFESRRLEADRTMGRDPDRLLRESVERPEIPLCNEGNRFWTDLLSPGAPRRGSDQARNQVVQPGCPRVDLSLIARRVMQETGTGLAETVVRSRWGGKSYSEARRNIAVRATAAGYTGREIANYLRLSPAAVSGMINLHRKQLLALDR